MLAAPKSESLPLPTGTELVDDVSDPASAVTPIPLDTASIVGVEDIELRCAIRAARRDPRPRGW